MDRLLEVKDLETCFETSAGMVRAVDGLSFSLDRGERLAVVGESGSGKSVAALSLLGLVGRGRAEHIGGEVRFAGRDLLALPEAELCRIRGNRIAMVFQDPMTSLNPVHRVVRQVAEPLRVHLGMSRRDAEARAVELLDLVGIPDAAVRAQGYPHQFSGGMRQRAMIAMALACDPDILIADEPTTALDVTIQAQILELIIDLQQRTASAIVMITHDLGVAAGFADRVLVMYAGKAVEQGSVHEIFRAPAHPYTWGLLDSLPGQEGDERGRLRPIEGQPPSLIDLPPGCAFQPRCPYAKAICRSQRPALSEISSGRVAACHFAGRPGFVRGCSEEVA